MDKYMFYYDFAIGKVGIIQTGDFISGIVFGVKEYDIELMQTPLIQSTANQLSQYFEGKLFDFDVPIFLNVTPFQRNVYEKLRQIPYGKTASYKQLAAMAGNIKSCRAVGLANNKNPIPIIIPCHRIIGSDGSLTGYAGGLEIKQTLLTLENKFSRQIKS